MTSPCLSDRSGLSHAPQPRSRPSRGRSAQSRHHRDRASLARQARERPGRVLISGPRSSATNVCARCSSIGCWGQVPGADAIEFQTWGFLRDREQATACRCRVRIRVRNPETEVCRRRRADGRHLPMGSSSPCRPVSTSPFRPCGSIKLLPRISVRSRNTGCGKASAVSRHRSRSTSASSASHPALVTITNADSCERLHLTLPFDARRAQETVDRADRDRGDAGRRTSPRFDRSLEDWRCRMCTHLERCRRYE